MARSVDLLLVGMMWVKEDIGLEICSANLEKIWLTRVQHGVAQSKQKGYADISRQNLEF